MSVSLVHEALGSFEFELLGNVPRDVLDEIDYFGHIAIIPGRLDPRQYGDGCLDGARYVGVVRRKKYADDGRTKLIQDDIRIDGVGMNFWLGDDDNKGYIIDPAVNFTNATFASALSPVASGGLIPPSLTVGTIHPIVGTYSGQHQYETPRSAIQYICDTLSDNSSISGTGNGRLVWRVNNDGSFDAGPERDMVVVNPKCIIMRKGSTQGEDMTIRSLPATLDMDMDREDFATKVIMLAEADGGSLATGSADINTVAPGVNTYKDLFGNALNLTKLVSESETIEQWADVRAELALRQSIDLHQQLTLNADDFDIQGSFEVGDYLWVYDPDGGLVDTNNEVYIRGVRVNPVRLRVTETDFPITEGYTVAYRSATGKWSDLTDYIHWEEDQPSKIVVGDFGRSLTSNGESIPIRLGALNSSSEDATTPDTPAFTTPFTSSSYEAGDALRSTMIVVWSTPTNTDSSAITDGNVYEVGYKLTSGSDWDIAFIGWGTNRLALQTLAPQISYDFRIRAVDINANQSAWSTTYTQSTSGTPSIPGVPGSFAVSTDSAEDTQGVLKAFAGPSWTVPVNTDTSPILDGDSYDIQYKVAADSIWSTQSVFWGATSSIIDNLNPGESYDFRIRAKDTSGHFGAFSSIVTKLMPNTPSTPGAPVLAVPGTDSSEDTAGNLHAVISLSWTLPTNTDSSIIIDGDSYEVQYKVSADSVWTSSTIGWGTLTTIIPALLTGTLYNFRVRAIDNSGHIGAWSNTRNITTSSTVSVPAAPAWVTPFATATYETVLGTKAQILVDWTTPLNTDGSTVIDGAYYEVGYKLTTQTAWDMRTVPFDTTQLLLSDLVPNTSYDFRIRAIDAAANVGAYSGTVTRVSGSGFTVPNAPTWQTALFSTGAHIDSNGNTKAGINIVWTTPLNTDGTGIIDGNYYEIQYRTNTGLQYSQTWTEVSAYSWNQMGTWEQPVDPNPIEWSTFHIAFGENDATVNDLSPGTSYDFRIRAVDLGGNQGNWSSITTANSAVDNIAPSTPAAPSVAGSLIAVQITHYMGVATGGTYNLDKDLAYLEIHAEYEPGFVPTTTTHLGNLRANNGMMVSQTPAVGTYQIQHTVPVYVKVVAVDTSGNRSAASNAAQATASLIDDEHISNLTVSKLTAGEITADWLLSGSIKTSESGARMEIDGLGLRAYNTDEINTVNIASQEGTVDLVGSVSSLNYVEGESGWRIDAQGNTQFANLYITKDVGAQDGYFRDLYMNGILVPSKDVLDAHYNVPFPAGRIHATGSNTITLTTTAQVLTYSFMEHERNCLPNSIWGIGQPGRIFAPTTGIYELSFNFLWNDGGETLGGTTVITARLNAGGSYSGGYKILNHFNASPGNEWTCNAARTTVFMNAGDYIELFALLGNGGVNSSQNQFGVGDGQGCVDFAMIASATGFGLDANATQTLPGGGTDGSGGGGGGAQGTSSKTWNQIDSTTFGSSGSIRFDVPKRCYQGYYDGTWGNQKSMVKFNYADIVNTLAGKEIVSCKLQFTVQHAYESGSLDAIIGTHNATSIATWNNTNSDQVRRYDCTAGATYTVDLGLNIGEQFRDGDTKGIVFGPGPSTSSTNYYGYFYGHNSDNSGPHLIIEYR